MLREQTSGVDAGTTRGWPSTSGRRLVPEIMDDPGLDPGLHRAALAGLGRINRISRSAAILWPAIRRAAASRGAGSGAGDGGPLRVLDLACGGGDVLIGLERRARAEKIAVRWTGMDMSATAVDYARRQAEAAESEIAWRRGDAFGDWPVDGFDLVMNSLFMHHLDRTQAVGVLRQMAAAGSTVLINDLRRGGVAYAVSVVGTRLLSRSRVVHVDGPRSVRAAWSVREMQELAEEAGLLGARVVRRFPWRMLLEWSADDLSEAAASCDRRESMQASERERGGPAG